MITQRNQVTGDLLKTKTNGNDSQYESNWDLIWKKPNTPIDPTPKAIDNE